MKQPRETGHRGRYLRVDPIACDGYGLCAELLPELVTLDDWGYPIMAAREVDGDLAKEAETVVKICPKLALRLDD
jgi:ferredoxin